MINCIRPQEADETVDIQVELVLMNQLKTKTGTETESKEDKGDIIEEEKRGNIMEKQTVTEMKNKLNIEFL